MNFEVISPETKPALLKAVKQNKNFRFGAGYTDLILDLKKQDVSGITIINLAKLKDKQFTFIEKSPAGIRIGSLVTAATLVNDPFIEKNFPVLFQAANSLASAQIRQVATLGGNLCTASPSGDIACALVALKAICEIVSSTGKQRSVPVMDFFKGPRKTILKKDEILGSVLIPVNGKNKVLLSGFIKIGTRRSMECSVVSLSYHVQTDKKGNIADCGIALGAVAPTIKFAAEACNFLKGKNISMLKNGETNQFANKVLKYASPISDVRASAWYRKEVLFNISRGLFEN